VLKTSQRRGERRIKNMKLTETVAKETEISTSEISPQPLTEIERLLPLHSKRSEFHLTILLE